MRTGSTLLAFDFDGTLAPICDDPSAVRLPRAAKALLREASHVRGLSLAIASGRDVADVAARTAIDSAYVIGSHGLEILGPGGVPLRDAPPLSTALPHDLAGTIVGAGLRVERKKHGIALHWRGVDIHGIRGTIARFREWVKANDLDAIDGRCVLEGRMRGEGKGEAIRWLASAIGAARVIYAGDDATDFGALQFAATNGRGVFVRNDERVPPPGVTVVGSFLELFRVIRHEVMI